jgi:hypothetical protein
MRETVPGVPANVIAIAVAGRASVVFRLIARYHCEYASANHGGLTPPALALHECVSAGDLRVPLHARYLTTGANVPRSWLYMRLCIARVAISPAHVRACKQERRA